MKKLFLALITCFASIILFSQTTEVSFTAGSGFFFYGGKSSIKKQNAYMSDIPPVFISGFPGRSPALSLSGGVDVKSVAKSKLVTGVRVEFQRLISKSKIDSLVVSSPDGSGQEKIVGEVKGVENLISLYPYAGKRLLFKNISIDLIGGVEFAFRLSDVQHASSKRTDGLEIFNDKKKTNSKTLDGRLNILSVINYKKLSLNIGYSHGVTNYFKNRVGEEQPEAYSHFIQIGLGYRIN